MVIGIGSAGVILVILFLVNRRGDIKIAEVPELQVTSPAFEPDGMIPVDCTGNGEDWSPELRLSDLDNDAVSIAVIMDDIDHPLVGVYNHWVIWNLPVQQVIPAKIPEAKQVTALGETVQGIGYGKHRYRGPKPPFGTHRYKFNVFVLDTKLDLASTSRKKDLLEGMEGHILQYGKRIGQYSAK